MFDEDRTCKTPYIIKTVTLHKTYEKLLNDIEESIHILRAKIEAFRDAKSKDVNQCVKASDGAMLEGDLIYVLTDSSLYCWINENAFLVQDQFTDIKI